MMATAAALMILAQIGLSQAAPARSEETPRGEWYNTDLRGLEALPGGTCVRLWLEERTYSIVPSGEGRFIGTYFNVIRATPVGAPSFRQECKFPPPADSLLPTQIRGWSILGNKTSGQTWRVRAEPGPPGGDLRSFKTEEFETKLYRQGEHLVDSGDDGEDPNRALVFRPPGSPPEPARIALEDTIRRLHNGSCLEVMSRLSPAETEDSVREICTLRQRMTQISGRLLSISVQSATELDRVPVGFPSLISTGHHRQRGVLFAVLSRYEKQEIPGHAVVFEEEGTWHVVQLWL